MTFQLVTPPAQEPLDLATAKLWARIDGTALDPLIPGMIVAARQIAEQETGARLITQTWRQELDDWPAFLDTFALFPVQSVDLSYWNGSAWTALAGQAVSVRDKFGVHVRQTVGGAYAPLVATTGPRVRADFVVGYGDDATDVPQAIRQFIAAHVAYWVRNPEAALDRAMSPSPFLSALLDPFRTYL
jgi:uncharacterized phiE125 gp8 family phage protein